MNKLKTTISYLVIFTIIFVFGWQSASYYILKRPAKIEVHENASNISSLSALTEQNNSEADLTLFWKVWRLIFKLYVDEKKLDRQKMIYGAIKGVVSSLDDPFTVYMTPDESKEFDESLNQSLEGIGAELTVKDQTLMVVKPLKNSPAEKAGLLPGDIIYKIDSNIASDMTLLEAITKIRGAKGTKVTLTILRKNKDAPFDIAILRDQIDVESVTMEEKEGNIFYISINQFSDNTKEEFNKIVQRIILKEPKGIILDLRYNGGGYLDIAVDISSELLKDKKEAVTIKKRNSAEDETIFVSGDGRLTEMPLVVLVNKGSASASEIVAGAIQDHKRGIVIGEQTFGKGSVQEVDKLSDGSSLRITIAHWLTPSGRNINETGITPDKIIENTQEDIEKNIDSQLEEAIKYLKEL